MYTFQKVNKNTTANFSKGILKNTPDKAAGLLRSELDPTVPIFSHATVEHECLAYALKANCPELQVVVHSRVETRFDVQPDVVLIGFSVVDLSNGKAFKTIESVRNAFTNVPIVILVEDDENVTAWARLIDMGISGYLSYSAGIEGLTKVLWLVLLGGACFPRDDAHYNQSKQQTSADSIFGPSPPVVDCQIAEVTQSGPQVMGNF